MKVAPAEGKKLENPTKINQYLQYGIGMFACFFGLLPFKIDKENWALSFRWISSETIWSLVRLVIFNFPLSFLPVILGVVYGPGEWSSQEGGLGNLTNQTISVAPTVYLVVYAVEYISSYTYFILQRSAKKEFLAIQWAGNGEEPESIFSIDTMQNIARIANAVQVTL